jgi:hypothetical protein
MIGSTAQTLPVPTMNASRIQSTLCSKNWRNGREPGTLNDTSCVLQLWWRRRRNMCTETTECDSFRDDFDSDDEMESERKWIGYDIGEMFTILAGCAATGQIWRSRNIRWGIVSKIPNLMFSAGLVALTAVIRSPYRVGVYIYIYISIFCRIDRSLYFNQFVFRHLNKVARSKSVHRFATIQ